jgi:hypothetical protein
MGEMKAPVRGTDLSPGDVDPFADLADLFEAEMARDDHALTGASTSAPGAAAQRPWKATTRMDPPSLDDDFDAAFADALSDVDEPEAPAPAPRRPAAASLHTTRGPAADSELNQALRGLSAPARPRDGLVFETQSFAPERVVETDDHRPPQAELDEFDQLIASELAMMQEDRRSPSRGASAFYAEPSQAEEVFDEHSYEAGDPSGAYYDDEAHPPVHAETRSPFRRSMVSLGGGVASLAILGAVGLFMWNGSSSTSGVSASSEPLLIKADAEPYKIEPKDPGGRTIPNQNKAVYERVAAGEGQGLPSTTQQALLTDAEEPIDLPPEEPPATYDDLPGVDVAGSDAMSEGGDARLASAVGDAPTPAVEPVGVLQPRKVRTMVVRPDGTLVPASAEPAAPAAPSAGAPTPGLIAVSSPALPASAAPTQEPAQAPLIAAVDSPAPTIAAAPAPSSPPVEAAPPPAPAADDSAPREVASITPSAPAPAGAYYVQISSQPSEALAQQSLRNLTGRYSGMIAGRSVGIQSADIPGKGTFYRVRVATASKDEASALCNQLKSAGGNCFVAR